MKNNTLKGLGLVLSATVIVACNPLGKMIKNAGTVNYNLTPNPLEMHNDSVKLAVSGKYPEKYFHKKATVEITPILKLEGGGTKELEKISLRGEAAEGEGNVVKTAGGSFNLDDKIAYEKAMESSSLELKIVGKFKGKEKEFPMISVGTGTIITPKLVQSDDKPILIKDKFTKTEAVSSSAEINFTINSSQVSNRELRQDDINALSVFINEGNESGLAFKNVKIEAYASPDGEISKNDNLANERAEAASKAINAMFKKYKVEAAKSDGFYNNTGKGEDWDGFKTMMKASTIADKELIIRILEMYSDLDKRELEIKALAKTYLEVSDQILPKLRRAQITVNAEKLSKTDDVLKQMSMASPDSLREEELLYSATLFEDLNDKLKIYRAMAKKYPNDARGFNNAGYILILQNKIADAKTELTKAGDLDKSNKIIKNNLGVIARLMGDRSKAAELYEAASGAGPEVSRNVGIINIQTGEYSLAVSNLSGANTFNEALANLLNGNADVAAKIIDASDDKSTAQGYYLKAICGAKKKSIDMILTNLKSAISKDASFKAKAAKDAEFASYFEDANFKALVQ